MSIHRSWAWTGRLVALVAAVVIPACGGTGSPGGANPNGILWNSQGSTNNATGTATQYWINPNLGVVGPIGISNIIVSTDDATYGGFFPHGTGLSGIGSVPTQKIVYIATGPSSGHPMSTDTGSTAITSRENQLEGDINTYRQRQLGNVGGGGLGGGVVVANNAGIILAGHFTAQKSARAHCKHYAKFEGGFPPGQNAEGDSLLTTGPAPLPAFTPGTPQLEPDITPPVAERGRLGKVDVIANAGASVVLSDLQGTSFPEPDNAIRYLIQNNGPTLLGAWDSFAVGHWRGGPLTFYWNIIFLAQPQPAN